jgi:methionyl-tRNA formyltransferase
MRMDAGLDTGPVLLQVPIPIGPRETAGGLTEVLAALGAQAIVEALSRLDSLTPQPQAAALATHAPKVTKDEARIDWRRPAEIVDRQIRAFNPVPGAETTFRGEILKVWEAEPGPGDGPPGTVLEAENGRRLAAADFLPGAALARGVVLGEKPLASA